jgi:hypothetical protein
VNYIVTAALAGSRAGGRYTAYFDDRWVAAAAYVWLSEGRPLIVNEEQMELDPSTVRLLHTDDRWHEVNL